MGANPKPSRCVRSRDLCWRLRVRELRHSPVAGPVMMLACFVIAVFEHALVFGY